MIKHIRYFLRITLFYVILFALYRLLFIVINHEQLAGISFSSIRLSFFYGIRMDLATIAYILVIPVILCVIHLSFPVRFVDYFLRAYHIFVIVILSIIQTGDVVIYHFWKSRLNWRALSYIAEPKEVMASATGLQALLIVSSFLLLAAFQIYFFRKYFSKKIPSRTDSTWFSKIATSFSLVVLLFIVMRGGTQELPINESSVYYSTNQLLNLSAVNGAWHLAHNMYSAGIGSENSFVFMDKKTADEEVKNLYSCKADSFTHVLKTDQPNVVILILESFTADLIEALGGEKDRAPNFNRLVKEGILFTNIYASGARTDQGIVSVISGFPATPNLSIMRNIDKSAKLPSLTKQFREKKYVTSFYYGGKTDFSNLNTYLISSNFENTTDENSFDKKAKRNKWGVHDEYVLQRQVNDLNKSTQPFFSVIMTLSSHEPFDEPGEKRFPEDNLANQFRNAAGYADRCLGTYFENAKKQSWFSHTLFILVADHGHPLPLNRNRNLPVAHHIPLLFYGDVLKEEFKGTKVPMVGGHHDLPATLLQQLGMKSEEFAWSKNLFNPSCSGFAYYEQDEGCGWIEKDHWTVFLENEDRPEYNDENSSASQKDTLRLHAKAFLQKLFREYLDY